MKFIFCFNCNTGWFSTKLKKTIFLVPSFAAVILFSCNSNRGQQEQGAGGPGGQSGYSGPQTYKVLTLQPRSATLNTEYPASLQGEQNIEIRPKVDGFIEQIYVDEGAIVKKGQLLFKLNAPQYAQDLRTAQAGIETAQADVNTAKLQVDKVKPLVEKDIISHYELDLDQNTLQSKLAALAQARASLENAKVNLAYTTITSPVDGVIGSLPYKLGSLVTSSTAQPLTTVYNTANIYAYFSMNEKKLLDFSTDSSNTSLQYKLNHMPPVTLVLSNGTIYQNTGKVETINGQINTSTGSANFRAGFVNPHGLLRTGSSATVRIPTFIKNAIIVPQSFTYQIQDKRFIYVVDAQSKVKNVAITVSDDTPGQFYIVTSGLKAGDKIIAEEANNVKDGTQIKSAEASADAVYKGLQQ